MDGIIWNPLLTIASATDTTLASPISCGTYWYNPTTNTLNEWQDLTSCSSNASVNNGIWDPVYALLAAALPNNPAIGTFWFNETTNILSERTIAGWTAPSYPVILSTTIPDITTIAINGYWFNTATDVLQQWDGATWTTLAVIAWPTDITTPSNGDLWWNTTTNQLFVWSVVANNWVQVTRFITSAADPSLPPVIAVNTAWINTTNQVLSIWDGSRWNVGTYFTSLSTPNVLVGTIYYNTTDLQYYSWTGLSWNVLTPTISPYDPTILADGTFWYNNVANTLIRWSTSANMWILLSPGISYSLTPLNPVVGTLWYDTTASQIKKWDGAHWIVTLPRCIVEIISATGNIRFTSTSVGSGSQAIVPYYIDAPASYWDALLDTLIVTSDIAYGFVANMKPNLFTITNPQGFYLQFVRGTDAVSGVPLYKQIGVGSDGTSDERRDIIEKLLTSLGYPTVQVELTKEQLEFCVDTSLSVFRKYSGSAYERSFCFMDFLPGRQAYFMTDKSAGMNKIVRIHSINRMTSAFLGTAQGQGVYGQMVLQHLYQMGSYDLLSYAVISDYVKLLEIMFASRVVFRFNEHTRRLDIFQNIGKRERVFIDCMAERTEQELMRDRLIHKWLLNWATAEAYSILANTRGKFGTLPGAGGSISLNADAMRQQSDSLMEKCMKEIDDFIVSEPEIWGYESTLIWG